MNLYRNLLADRYSVLPKAVQKLHEYGDEVVYSGQCDVVRGANLFCKFAAFILSLPPSGENYALKVHFRKENEAEHWTRYFGDKKFYSRQWADGGVLYEQINIVRLVFAVEVGAEALNLVLNQVYVFGIPVSWIFRPHVTACESEHEGRFIMNIAVHLPYFGLLVKYQGWLSVDGV